MLPEWRLLRDGIVDARHHFAVEEAIARLLDEGRVPNTLRLRQVKPSVFVGVHQNTLSEVNVAYCNDHNIQIVRRMNGGGAVYHEMGSFCYSAFFHRDFFPQSDAELYRLFAIPVIQTCADYGVSARFEGRNDVLVGNRKIYGSAQFSVYQAFVQSGTFLVNMDFETMARALTPGALKFAGKTVSSIQERVTSLSQEVGRELDVREIMNRFVENTADVLGIKFNAAGLSPEEQDLGDKLLKEKYSTDNWNFGSNIEFEITVAERTADGVVSLSGDMEGRTIKNIAINGDLLNISRQELDHLEKLFPGCTIQEAQSRLQEIPLPQTFLDAMTRLLEKLDRQVNEVSTNRQKEKD